MKTLEDFKGTKGSFAVKEGGANPGARIIDSLGNSIGDAHWGELSPESIDDRVKEAQANAKLFAASKDLLKVVLDLVNTCESGSPISLIETIGRINNDAKEAIKKAL